MVSQMVIRGIHRTAMTFGMAFLLGGVVLLTISGGMFILGACFLGFGSLVVIVSFLVTVSACVRKRRSEGGESGAEAEIRGPAATQRQTEVDVAQYDAPRYEDVMVQGPATVWTVTIGPVPDSEPPPYSAIASGKVGPIGPIGVQRPTLLRISSDIHEFKNSGAILEERWPEPLTPPPDYSDSEIQWEEDFQQVTNERRASSAGQGESQM
ncbi:hypothetical protein XENTR_v10017506 [Xenopus tropicalis]|uniref:Uncharacterized protein LOC101732043 n=1 Tax=Xenopus tropicalis TaxID=8364 RepID=A0A8J1JUG5_XENTR|nr:uncharacterized protein LOC101732043 [Xenopus tropicalis]KAE8589282.1 hypothetical protein XENTR_v10017506 [Xenopus tropicalis]KAE8589283.1 hypothetical protein XENTR_v10017506 [Xenopus tropicalis]KAE8589284.1 hypothetical protein XENTR_v10017506 [Xenopus tropicalis]